MGYQALSGAKLMRLPLRHLRAVLATPLGVRKEHRRDCGPAILQGGASTCGADPPGSGMPTPSGRRIAVCQVDNERWSTCMAQDLDSDHPGHRSVTTPVTERRRSTGMLAPARCLLPLAFHRQLWPHLPCLQGARKEHSMPVPGHMKTGVNTPVRAASARSIDGRGAGRSSPFARALA